MHTVLQTRDTYGRKLFKVLTVEVKVILACFGHISIKKVLK